MTIFEALFQNYQGQLKLANQVLAATQPYQRSQVFTVFAQSLSCHKAAENRYFFTELAQLNDEYFEVLQMNMVEHHEFDEMINNLSLLPVEHEHWLVDFVELINKLKAHIAHKNHLFAFVENLFSKELQRELGIQYRQYMHSHLNIEVVV